MSTNELHEANRRRWNAATNGWKKRTDERGIWKNCHRDPSLVLTPSELSLLEGVRGKSVCVLGSGDNEVVFALAGMGADVTSIDISERQLETARGRADLLDLNVSFLRADIADLSALESNGFDFVYTGGHVSVWLSDINERYLEAVRILKPGCLFIVNDYHPFRRIWKEGSKQLILEYSYFERGPFEYLSDEGLPQFEFHWTVADHISALLSAGCELLRIEEIGEENDEWNDTELKGLPQRMLFVGRKGSSDPANSDRAERDEPDSIAGGDDTK
jgi:SAM-dependent methyltransferase